MNSASVLLVPLVFLVALYLPRRARELSSDGRPLLRYYGPALLLAASAVFWIVVAWQGLRRGEFLHHRAGLYIYCTFLGLSLVFAVWLLLGWKTTLTEHSVEHGMWPLPTLRYHLGDVVSVKRKGVFSMEFAGGRRFGVLPVASGRKHFIGTLDAQLKALGK